MAMSPSTRLHFDRACGRAPGRVFPSTRHYASAWGLMLGLVVLLLMLTGCGSPGYVRADAIEGTVKRIAERHDAYTVAAVASGHVTKKQGKVDLRDTALLLKLIKTAQDKGAKK